ncbi:MAG TPA: ABC transporter permease [Gemmatimonadales bacterium]|nr:ABC transporter permease [Gemmatimonadales bacterium]
MSVQVEQKRLTAPGGRWPAAWARRQARPLIAWVLLAVLVATGVSTSASFRSGPVLMETLKGATFVGMASAAQFFAVVGGGIDLSVGSVATLSGMFAAVIMNGHDSAIPLAVLVSLGIGLAVGAINGLLVNLLRISPLITTFGMYYILQGVGYTYSVNPVGQAAPSFYNLYADTVAGIPVLLLIMAAFWAICWYVARQTAFGKHLYAVGGDRDAARLATVRTAGVSIASYVLCAVIAAMAGLLELTQTGVGAPDLGATLLLSTVTAVVIGGVSLFGGRGSVIGVLGGALVLGFLNELFSTLQVNAFYQELIQGLIILAALGIYRQNRGGR